MKRLLDLLIVVVILAIAALVYFVFVAKDGNKADDSASSGSPNPPAASASLPRLNEGELRGLLPYGADMIAVVGASVQPEKQDTVMADQVQQMREFWPDIAGRIETLSADYGWDVMSGYRYDLCRRVSYPIGELVVMVDQLDSAELARQYISDPQVLGFMTMGSASYAAADAIHGWYVEGTAEEGSCFDLETTHSLIFEYWGLLFSIDIQAQQGVTRAELQPLLDQMVTIMVTRVDALEAAAALPPTPAPPAGTIEPAAIPFPLTLEFLDSTLPADETFASDSALTLNHSVSRTYTLDEYVAAFRQLNLTEVADTLAAVGRQTGMVGQVVRVWDARGTCPDAMGVSYEFDFALFGTAEGTLAYLHNQSLQTAWVHTGLVTEYTSVDSDTLFVSGEYPNHACGPVYVTELRQAFGRVLAAVSITHYPSVPRPEVQNFLTETMEDLKGAFVALDETE